METRGTVRTTKIGATTSATTMVLEGFLELKTANEQGLKTNLHPETQTTNNLQNEYPEPRKILILYTTSTKPLQEALFLELSPKSKTPETRIKTPKPEALQPKEPTRKL